MPGPYWAPQGRQGPACRSFLTSASPGTSSTPPPLPLARLSRIIYEKRIESNLSSNQVHYTASSLPVILKNLCRKLHCQKGFYLNSLFIWNRPGWLRLRLELLLYCSESRFSFRDCDSRIYEIAAWHTACFPKKTANGWVMVEVIVKVKVKVHRVTTRKPGS